MIPREPLRTGALATLRAAVTDRWPVKLAALAFAVVLWLVVRAEEPTEVVLDARFVPLLDSSVVLASAVPLTVQVVVTGRTREVRPHSFTLTFQSRAAADSAHHP